MLVGSREVMENPVESAGGWNFVDSHGSKNRRIVCRENGGCQNVLAEIARVMRMYDGTPSEIIMNLPGSRRFLPVLLLLFFGSGCAALIYEIVWFQLLQLLIGSTAVSLGVLLGTFMGGMCLGSLALARFVSARRHPLRVYAALELVIGIVGIGLLFGIPYVEEVYLAFGHGPAGILLRAVV